MIDGVLQFDCARSGGAAEAATPLAVGPENRLLAAPLTRLLSAGDLPEIAASLNPLAIVSPEGSGKSLAVQGIVRAWSAELRADELAYYTAADFGRELQAAQGDERLASWRRQMRSLRMLVVEDVDRLRPRTTIQRELRATVDAILDAGGLVIVTAVAEPMTLMQLDPGLRDRLAAGLTVRIQRPELATRRAILAHAAPSRGLSLNDEQLDALAAKPCATAGQLLGRLAAWGFATEHSNGRRPSAPCSADAHARRIAAAKHILAVTARYFGLSQGALTSPSRRSSLVQARNIVVYFARRLTDLSYMEIGRILGGRDHTTMMHADRRLAERLATDPATQRIVEELDRLMGP